MYKQSPERESLGRELLEMQRSGLTNRMIGLKTGMTTSMVSGLIRTARLKADPAPKEFDVVHFGSPLSLSGDFMITGDVHLPTVKWDFVELLMKVSIKNNIKRLVLSGDIFNMDAFSVYRPVVAPVSWTQERDAGRVLFGKFLEWFEELIVIMGNHDRRMQRMTAGAFDETDIIGMVMTSDKIKTSNFGYLTIQTKSEYPWRVTHGRNYSVNQLTVGSELANKFQCNVISHHQHHLSKGWDRYKRFVIVDNGGLFDAEKFAYAKMDDNKMPNMANGFTMLKNGVATVFGRYPFTDWSEYF